MIGRAELGPQLAALPTGFTLRRGSRGVLAARSDLAAQLEAFGFGPEGDGPLMISDVQGRQPLATFELGQERFLVRRFSHGGLLRWLTGRRFLDPSRPFQELLLSERLRALGVATPEVVAARARPALGGGWHLDLVTRRIPDALDLGALLARARRGELEPSRLRCVLVAAGQTIRELHAAGLDHADLNPNNLLVPNASGPARPGTLWVLDLDRSRLCAQLPPARRRASLARLLRHVVRRERRHGAHLRRVDYARFLRAYAGESWKQEWRAIRGQADRWGWLHGLGGELERRFGRRHDPREVGA